MAETFSDQAARLAMLEIAIKLEAIARRAYAQEKGLASAGQDHEEKTAESRHTPGASNCG